MIEEKMESAILASLVFAASAMASLFDITKMSPDAEMEIGD